MSKLALICLTLACFGPGCGVEVGPADPLKQQIGADQAALERPESRGLSYREALRKRAKERYDPDAEDEWFRGLSHDERLAVLTYHMHDGVGGFVFNGMANRFDEIVAAMKEIGTPALLRFAAAARDVRPYLAIGGAEGDPKDPVFLKGKAAEGRRIVNTGDVGLKQLAFGIDRDIALFFDRLRP
jgi:hypothetical protein